MTLLAADTLDAFPLLSGLLGGLALFLYGLEQLAGALRSVAGNRMRSVLARLTSNRFMGVLTGAFVTAVIQSSSVTTVLVVGFVTAGVMSLAQSVGVIMGANIGTTVTAQVIAFKVTEWALVIVAAGFAMVFLGKRKRVRRYGAGVLGLGLVFFGMTIMGDAMAPLRDYEPFLDWMLQMERPLLGILAGAAFTALVQSSSATTAIAIVMAGEGLISLPGGIALIFGANIGTCVTALLAAIGKPREAVRAAVVHVLFNVVGVALWIGLIDVLADAVSSFSPARSDLVGTDRLAAETPRQIANAHTVFNVANTLLLVWFAPVFARVAVRLAPDRPLAEAEAIRARYLDEGLIVTPSLALDRCRLEILRQGEIAEEMLAESLPAVLDGPEEAVDALHAADDRVDALHGQIIGYLGRISQEELDTQQTEELMRLMEATNDLENIGDVLSRDLGDLGQKRIERGVAVSPQTREVIGSIHAEVQRALSMAIQAVTQRNVEAARVVTKMKPGMKTAAGEARRHEAVRLVADEPGRIAAYRLETDIIENLSRVYYFSKRMARGVVRGDKAAAG